MRKTFDVLNMVAFMLTVVGAIIWFLMWLLLELFDAVTGDSTMTIIIKCIGFVWLVFAINGWFTLDKYQSKHRRSSEKE